MYVPVVSNSGKPLMPCHPARARELVRKGKALRRFKKGIFYIQLIERSDGSTQPIAVGVDPGSKKEGYTVMSERRTFLNIQPDAVTHVSKAVKTRREMRRGRRFRKTPCRKPRFHRKGRGMPPSTRARWGAKLRVCRVLTLLFPIRVFVVEDIQAEAKQGQRRWNKSFSPLQVGKQWFYGELGKLARVETKEGWETKEMRDELGLKKTGKKLSNSFDAHCVDSWVLARSGLENPRLSKPENTRVMFVRFPRLHRRQLHRLKPMKGGRRPPYGGTRSQGFKRGSLIKHAKHGICVMGGSSNNRVSIHDLKTGKRITISALPSECETLAFNTWLVNYY